MKVYGVSAYDVDTVVTEVSRRLYDGNVILKSIADRSNSRGPRATFTLRTLDSAAGKRGAVANPNRPGSGPNGLARRIGACWHAHWDVIEELFRRFPGARVTSGFRLRGVAVTYTAETFTRVALETAHLNVGSWERPVTMPQCCECDHSLYAEAEPRVRPELSGQVSAARVPGTADEGTVYAGAYDSDEGWVPTVAPDESEYWAEDWEAGRADTSVPYLGGLVAAQPYRKLTAGDAAETVARIDAVLAEVTG